MSSSGSGSDNFSDQPLHALEEQLNRQKSILANSALLKKLPDKGEKIKASIVKIEAEVEKRKQEQASKRAQMSSKEIEELEWALGAISFLSKPKATKSDINIPCENGSVNGDEESLNPNPLEIVATSQISQRQPKPVISDKLLLEKRQSEVKTDNDTNIAEGDLDRFSSRLVRKDCQKSEKNKFVPSKTYKTASPAPRSSNSNSNAFSSKPKEKGESERGNKWAETLIPPNQTFESSKLLSLDETLALGNETSKHLLEVQKSKSAKKVYAFDRLKEQGLLGSYTVEMQVNRPLRRDQEKDDFDEDISQDEITEDSESDADDESNQQTNKDLSLLVNSSLQLK